MDSNDDNSGLGLGCLFIIGIVILCAIVRAIIKWANENSDTMIKIGVGIGVVIVCWIVWGVTKESRKLRNDFDEEYGNWLDVDESSIDNAEEFAKNDSKYTEELNNRVTELKRSVEELTERKDA